MVNSFALWKRCGSVLALLALAAAPAAAQTPGIWTDRGFVNVSGGVQPTGRTHVAEGEFDLYDELGSFDASLTTRSAGIFDVQTGLRVWDNFAVAVAYSRYADRINATVNTSIPHPLFVGVFENQTIDVGGLKHVEHGVHMSAGYMLLVPDLSRLRMLFVAGPTVFSLNKSVISAINVVPGTQTADGVVTQNVSATGLGAHFGADVQYTFNSRFGAGLLLRWASGTVDVPQISGGRVKVGGLTVAGGLRYSF